MDPLSLSKLHYNLIWAMKNLAEKLPFAIQWMHIKGQQHGKTIMVLPQEAWLNIKANMVAK